jgi:hypothetical protein
MKWLITDDKNVVQDIAANENNLSRGYIVAGVPVGDDVALMAAGFHKYQVADTLQVEIFDIYDGSTVTPNTVHRATVELDSVEREIIQLSVLHAQAVALSFSSIASEYSNALSDLYTKKATLEAVINA